jgi:hypothetical protein
MSVAGSLASIDEAFKRYALGVDEWRETMRSLKDAEEQVGNIMRDREILCVVLFFFLFFVSYIYIYIFRVTRLIKGQLEEKRGRQHQRVAAPQPPAISVVVFALPVYWWGIPVAIAFSCVILTPPFTRV